MGKIDGFRLQLIFFYGKIDGFRLRFPFKQSMEMNVQQTSTPRIKATVSRRARAGGSRPPMTAMEAAWQCNTL